MNSDHTTIQTLKENYNRFEDDFGIVHNIIFTTMTVVSQKEWYERQCYKISHNESSRASQKIPLPIDQLGVDKSRVEVQFFEKYSYIRRGEKCHRSYCLFHLGTKRLQCSWREMVWWWSAPIHFDERKSPRCQHCRREGIPVCHIQMHLKIPLSTNACLQTFWHMTHAKSMERFVHFILCLE